MRYTDVTDDWTKCCSRSQETQLETAERAVLSGTSDIDANTATGIVPPSLDSDRG